MSLTCKDISDEPTAKSVKRPQANFPRVPKSHFTKSYANTFLTFIETTENWAPKARWSGCAALAATERRQRQCEKHSGAQPECCRGWRKHYWAGGNAGFVLSGEKETRRWGCYKAQSTSLLDLLAKDMQMLTSSCHSGLLLVSTFCRGKWREALMLSELTQNKSKASIGNRAMASKPSPSTWFAGCAIYTRRLKLLDHPHSTMHRKTDRI